MPVHSHNKWTLLSADWVLESSSLRYTLSVFKCLKWGLSIFSSIITLDSFTNLIFSPTGKGLLSSLSYHLLECSMYSILHIHTSDMNWIRLRSTWSTIYKKSSQFLLLELTASVIFENYISDLSFADYTILAFRFKSCNFIFSKSCIKLFFEVESSSWFL